MMSFHSIPGFQLRGTAPSALTAYGLENVDALLNAGIAGALMHMADIRPGLRVSKL